MAEPKDDRTQIGMRIKNSTLEQLDSLCEINGRARRDIFEILIADAYATWKADPTDRINPS